MHQGGQDVALAAETLGELSLLQAGVGKFEGDLTLESAVAAFGKPHRAHAAAAELAQQPVGADLEPLMEIRAIVRGQIRRRIFRQRRQRAGAAQLGSHQLAQPCQLFGHQAGLPFEPGRPVVLRKLQHLVEQPGDYTQVVVLHPPRLSSVRRKGASWPCANRGRPSAR